MFSKEENKFEVNIQNTVFKQKSHITVMFHCNKLFYFFPSHLSSKDRPIDLICMK